MSSDYSDDGAVGYRRPPKRHQFKKGQSGCPDGGHESRRSKKRARIKKEEDAIGQKVIDFFTARHTVRINGEMKKLTVLEVILTQLQEEALVKREPGARNILLGLAAKHKWLDAPPPRPKGSGVLVVYPTLPLDVWTKATEGQLLTKDPLEGIPGYDAATFEPGRKRGRTAE